MVMVFAVCACGLVVWVGQGVGFDLRALAVLGGIGRRRLSVPLDQCLSCLDQILHGRNADLHTCTPGSPASRVHVGV